LLYIIFFRGPPKGSQNGLALVRPALLTGKGVDYTGVNVIGFCKTKLEPKYTITCMYNLPSKAIPLQAWTGPEGSRRLRFPDFKTIGT
jgi:hypothetical protein